MKLRERYRRLTFWNKLFVLSSVCSILALLLAVVNFVVTPKPQTNIYYENIFNIVDQQIKNANTTPVAARTFWILKEEGASITLGPCPSNKCLYVKLGKLKKEENQLSQEFILSGGVFNFFQKKTEKKVGNEIKGTIAAGIEGDFIFKGPGIAKFFIAPFKKKVFVNLPILKGAEMKILTKKYDISFYIDDTKTDSLKIKLEICTASNKM